MKNETTAYEQAEAPETEINNTTRKTEEENKKSDKNKEDNKEDKKEDKKENPAESNKEKEQENTQKEMTIQENTPTKTTHPTTQAKTAQEAKQDKITSAPQTTSNKDFYLLEFDKNSEIFQRIKGKSYKDNCTVPVSDLRYLHVMHIGFDGQPHEGEIICNKYIAEDLLEIFEALYEAQYPIEKIKLVDEYNADDESSMADNNSSSFNFRFISYTTKISKHGYGLAMDINTLYNPYVKTVDGQLSIEPANAAAYVDRSQDFPHKIDENDLAYKLFTEHGFEWGGAWKKSKDYQHFEVSDSVVKKLYN